jgi:hypothetical protein
VGGLHGFTQFQSTDTEILATSATLGLLEYAHNIYTTSKNISFWNDMFIILSQNYLELLNDGTNIIVTLSSFLLA